MKDIQIILENLASQGISPDKAQKLFLEKFIDFDTQYTNLNLFKKKSNLSSLYLWGPVGRGKTLLLQAIKDSYFQNSGAMHYLEFMQLIHTSLSELANTKNPLLLVAKNISKKYSVIFIDEFQVEDIADAMIMQVILEALHQNGVRMMLSSNTPPSKLYKDGLQRNKFLKTIDFIKSEFMIFNLEGEEDYRLREISLFNTFANNNVEAFLQTTFNEPWSAENIFHINGREFSCEGQSQIFLWVSFQDFFSEPCGSKDFIEMCKTYEWIFISNFHACSDDHLDKIRRFISFIDITYQEHQKMKLFSESTLLQNLYQGSQLDFLWERSVSRLHEISGKNYLEDLKKN